MTERQTFCIYCQHEYGTPQALRKHIEREHPGTYADTNVNVGYTRAEVIAVLEGNMDEPLDRLAATSPDLLTAMYTLIDEYGLLGVQRTLAAITSDYGQETADG